MAYTHWYHKQGQRNNSESPDPNTGFSSNHTVDEEQNQKSSTNLAAAGMAIGVQGVRVFNKFVDTTGSSKFKKEVKNAGIGIGLASLFIYSGLPGLAAAGLVGVGNVIIGQMDEYERQEEDRYKQKLIGERTQKYNKGGEYND